MLTAVTTMYVLVLVFSVLLNLVSARQCNVTTNEEVKWIVDCSSMELVNIPSALPVEPILYLKLSNNSLSHLLDFSFSNWTSILELDLSKNNINVIYNNSFHGLVDLTSLNLSSNSLKYFTSNITRDLPSMKILDLSDNLIKVIGAGTFQPVLQLQKLFLGNNVGLGDHLSQFETLKISLHQGLRLFDLSNITLTKIPDDFLFDATHLNILYLGNNLLMELPRLPESLTYLDLSSNPVERIPDGCFQDAQGLRVLILKAMPNLKELPEGSLKGLGNLTTLTIEYCPQLYRVAAEIFGPSTPRLKKLSISHCHLETLHKYLQQFLVDVEYLDLQDNPWCCDDRLSWLKWANIEASLLQDLRCYQPENARDMPVKDYYSPLRTSASASYWINIFIFMSIVGVCIVAVVAMVKHLSQERAENYLQLRTMGCPQVPSRNLNELLH